MQSSMSVPSSPSIGQRIIRGRWIGKIFLIVLAALVVLRLAQGFSQSPTLFWQQVINGLQLGFVYALIALGYTMVYGIVRLINFAHGDVFMVGAFASYFAISRYEPAHLAAGSYPQPESRCGHPDRHDFGAHPFDGGLRLAGHHDRAHRLQAAA